MEYQRENKYYVYALVDPINKAPFYIGKGCGNRAYSHLKNEQTNMDKIKTIANIRMLNFEPKVMFISKNLSEKDAYGIENIIIKNSLSYGFKLVNKSGLKMPPNRKGCVVSTKTKLKISMSLKGRKKSTMSQETRDKISKSNKGKAGPGKVFVDNINDLKTHYINKNFTKEEICSFFNIGLGSLNRILKINNIKKTALNFSNYSKKSSQKL